MNTNYNYIINISQEFAVPHNIIGKAVVSFADQRSFILKETNEHPVFYLIVDNFRLGDYTIEWNIRVRVTDNIFDDRSNVDSVMNTTGEIINHFLNFLRNKKGDQDHEVEILDIGLANPLNNVDENKMNGWEANFTISSRREQCFDGRN